MSPDLLLSKVLGVHSEQQNSEQTEHFSVASVTLKAAAMHLEHLRKPVGDKVIERVEAWPPVLVRP